MTVITMISRTMQCGVHTYTPFSSKKANQGCEYVTDANARWVWGDIMPSPLSPLTIPSCASSFFSILNLLVMMLGITACHCTCTYILHFHHCTNIVSSGICANNTVRCLLIFVLSSTTHPKLPPWW